MERLQYISQETEKLSHLEGIEKACEAGVKWIQMRVKNKNEQQVTELAKAVQQICNLHNCYLIINDHASVAKQINANGVHLGKEDMSVSEARKLIGDSFTIGGTANTIDEIEMHFRSGANYVGVGPFKFTTTKQKLSPILGLEGYRKIMDEYSKRNISIPVIAIGGIELNDIKEIMSTGIYGIAVSGLIANAIDAKATVKQINESINASIFTTC
ncbi:MAG TPA: thiamine phosphate synthase [Bacteroidia bacterium]|jgi:thiamine-phosphate pyrophosphorylase|nr:thiamine phosphate synthase [Bacteroidia bacterium]